jgi:triacylglycerol lipase
MIVSAVLTTSSTQSDETTGQALFDKVDPSIRNQVPPLLRQGLDQVVVETGVTYTQRPSGPLKLDIYRSKRDSVSKPEEPPRPAVVVIHGGSWKSGDRSQLGLYAASLARRGYVAYAIEYRLAPRHPWPAQWEDVRDAVIWLKKDAKRQNIDPNRIGAVGYSAGGHLATMLATIGHQAFNPESPEITAAVKCVAAGGAPCDFSDMQPDNAFLKYWLGSTRKENPDVYVQASPLKRVSAASAPIFFYNGTFDLVVRPKSAKSLSDELVKLGIDSAVHLIPGAGHITAAIDETALGIAWTFLDKHLKPAKTGADENPKDAKGAQDKP